MVISKGQLIFAVIFFIVFVIVMVWAYRSERKTYKLHYKGVYVVLLALLGFVLIYRLAVHYFNK